MILENYYSDDEDLKLIFEKVVDWEAVVHSIEGKDFADHAHYQKTNDERYALAPATVEDAIDLYRSTIEAMGGFWGKVVAEAAPELDKAGLQYKDGVVHFPDLAVKMYEDFRDTGLLPYALPREAGGLKMPAVMWALLNCTMARADVSFLMTVSLANLAQLVTRYGTEEQVEQFAAPMGAGETLFAMALTEPDYGSDLGNVRTVATKREDGTYVLNGTKRYISQGCGLGPYPATMIALARTGKQGARGLSAFLVNSKDAIVGGIEKKIGIHASPTCEIVFEDTPGVLLGEEGQGLTKMTIGMTSFMRLTSASGGAGGAAAAYKESEKYGRERIQFGKPIQEIPAVAEMIDTLRRETNAMRLMVVETGFAVDRYIHEQIRLEKQGVPDREIRRNEEIRDWSILAAFFTSLAKYYCSEKGVECTSIALQVHGGAGYTDDYDVSRMYRDSRVNTIYEGTSQLHVGISSGMIVAGMGEGGYLRRYFDQIRSEVNDNASIGLELLDEQRKSLEEAIPLYRNLENGIRERYAEDLVKVGARYLCGLLYERAINKLGAEAPDYWVRDKNAFHIDSCGVAQAALTKMKNAGRVFGEAV